MDQAFVLTWTESERGWGTRPDGYSVHISAEEARQYVDRHWASFPQGQAAPDEYDRPDSEKPFGVVLQDAAFARMLKEKKSIRLWQRDATIETQSDGRRLLVIRSTELLLRAAGKSKGSAPITPDDTSMPRQPSLPAKSTPPVTKKATSESSTFVDLCLAKLVKPTEFKNFVDQWHQGAGRQFPNVWAFLGLTQDEFYVLMTDESKLYDVLFKRVLARNPRPHYVRVGNAQEPYLVHFTGRYEASLTPMVVYQKLNGDIGFFSEAAVDDKFIKRLSDEEGKAFEAAFQSTLSDNPKLTYALHVKSQGTYLVHFEGTDALSSTRMVVYQGLDGEIWIRDAALFHDGRFTPLP
jgi:hypothetical protein